MIRGNFGVLQQRREAQRTWHGLLCAIAVVFVGVTTGSCAGPRPFPHQLPNTNGFATDVTWQKAFRDHHIEIPSHFQGLRYSAYSQVDGYPVWAIFRASCGVIAGLIARTDLTGVSDSALLPSGSVYSFAQQMGWQPNSRGSKWYQRPAGPSANLEVLVARTASLCTVYLVGNAS